MNLETLSIVLSAIGIIISVASFIIGAVFTIKLFILDRRYKNVEILKRRAISLCCLYEDNKYIPGEQVIQEIMRKHNCDEWEAIERFSKTT